MASIININGKWRALVRKKGMAARCKTFDSEAEAITWAHNQERYIKEMTSEVYVNPAKEASVYHVSGVYMLLKGDEVRYIGRSTHIYRRLNDHARKELEWTKFRIFPCRDAIQMAEMERNLIERYQPPLNVAMKSTPVNKAGGKNQNIFTRYKRKNDDGWLPIETAPKSGEYIYMKNAKTKASDVGFWSADDGAFVFEGDGGEMTHWKMIERED